MGTLMLVNPKRRRRSSTKRRSTARRANPANPRRRRARRASNPVNPIRRVRRSRIMRSRNPGRRIRRRRNPISMRSLTGGSLMNMLKSAAIGGAGAVGVDIIMAKINGYLPASLRAGVGPGMNDIVRVALTVMIGKFASKATRGMSEKMAAGALTVQMARLIAPYVAQMMPSTAPAVAGLAWGSSARVIPGNGRVSPMSAYLPRGSSSPLLSRGVGAYTNAGNTLNRGRAMSGVRAR